MFRRVLQTIERHALLLPGQRVGVAVSGGADSVCLLHVLLELAPRHGWRLSVLHLDHGLRGAESRADAEFVRELAARHGLTLHLKEASLAGVAGNLEQAAREARLEFFRAAITSGCVDRAATAHTRSDQAETVLFRLLRGAGTAGLAGIRPMVPPGIVRPLLDIERGEVLAFLRRREISWREDSTNGSVRFARNRIRHDLLPRLTREWNPRVGGTLADTAQRALDDEAYWEAEVERQAALHLSLKSNAVLAKLGSFRSLPPALDRRLVRRAIEMVRGDLRGVDFHHVEAVLEILRRPEGHGGCDVPGVRVERSLDWVRFVAPAAPQPGFHCPLRAPGAACIPGAEISLELIEKAENPHLFVSVYNGEVGCLDWDRLSGALAVRNWEPGDRYQPSGATGGIKIKTLFQHARIPLWERSQWPILIDGRSIVWARRFGPAAGFEAGPETRVLLRIRETGCDPIENGIGTGQGGV